MADSLTVGLLRAILTLDSAQFESGMRQASTSSKALQRDLQAFGSAAQDVGRLMTGALTVPIVAGFAGAATAAIQFESSFAGVKKTVEATEAEFSAMSDSLRELATEIPVNVNELNRLAEAAGAMGIPKAEIVDFARVMAELGVTTNLTADQAAESIGKIQNIFGAAGQETENFASTLVALGNAGASTESQILEMATRIAAAGNTIGLSQADVLGFANALASLGLEAEAGGTAISRVFVDIAAAVSHGGEELAAFAEVAGLTSEQFRGLFREDSTEAVVQFIDGLGGIKAAGGDLILTLEDLGIKEVRLRDALLRMAGAGDMVRDSIRLANDEWVINTALTEEAQKRYQTTESQLTLLWNRLKDVAITFGNALLPMINAAIGAFNSFLPILAAAAERFAALPIEVQVFAVGLAGLVAAMGPLLILFGQMATGAASLIGVLRLLPFASITASVAPMTAAMATASGAFTTTAAAGGALTLTLSGLALAAGIAAAAFVGWQLGRVIGETTGLTDAIGKQTAKLGEWIGLLPQGAAAQYDAMRAAQLASEAQKAQAGAFDFAAEAAKRLREQISGVGLARDMEELTRIVKEMLASGPIELGAFNRIADAALNLQRQGQQLTPELQGIVDRFKDMQAAAPGAAGGLTRMSEEAKKAAIEIKSLRDELTGATDIAAARQMALALVGTDLSTFSRDARDRIHEVFEDAIAVLDRKKQEVPAKFREIFAESLNAIEAPITQITRTIQGAIDADIFTRASTEATNVLRGLTRDGLIPVSAATLDYREALMFANPVIADYTNRSELASRNTEMLTEEQRRAKAAAEEHAREIAALVSAFGNLGNAVGGPIGDVITGIGGIIGALDNFRHNGAVQGFVESTTAIVQGVANVWTAVEESATRGQAAINGAMQGAMAGLAFGPWGAAVGAGAGLVAGLVFGDDEGRQAAIQEAQGEYREFFRNLSDGFDSVATAADRARVGQDEHAQSVFMIRRAYEDFGISVTAVDRTIRGLESAYRSGSPEEIERVLRIVNEQLERHAQIMEDWTEGVSKFLDGFEMRIDGFSAGLDAMRELDAARGQALKDANVEQEEVLRLNQEFKDQLVSLDAEFERLAQYAVTAFSVVFAQTGSAIEALAAIKGPLDQLIAAAEEFGLTGSDTYARLADISEIVSKHQDVFTSIDGLTQMMEGLDQATLLTQEDFLLFAQDATSLFGELVGRGVDANTAMALMQPTLQTLWELQQRFGIEVDAATQALLDQAESAGIVGEAHRSINEQMLEALLQIEAAILRLPDAFIQSVQEANALAEAIRNIPQLPGHAPQDDSVYSGNVAVPRQHSGGFIGVAHSGMFVPGFGRLAADERAIIAQTGEGVINRSAVAAMGGSSWVNAINTNPWGAMPSVSMPMPGASAAGATMGSSMERNDTTIGDINVYIQSTGDPDYDGERAAMKVLSAMETKGAVTSKARRVIRHLVTQ